MLRILAAYYFIRYLQDSPGYEDEKPEEDYLIEAIALVVVLLWILLT